MEGEITQLDREKPTRQRWEITLKEQGLKMKRSKNSGEKQHGALWRKASAKSDVAKAAKCCAVSR